MKKRIAALFAIFVSLTQVAAKAPPEIYAATIDEPVTEPAVMVPESITPHADDSTPTAVARPKNPTLAQPKSVTPNRSTQASKVPVKKAPPTVTPEQKRLRERKVIAKQERPVTFDRVEKSHAQSVAARLETIRELILKHGRAYDYRSLTTAELKQILNGLEKKSAQPRAAE